MKLFFLFSVIWVFVVSCSSSAPTEKLTEESPKAVQKKKGSSNEYYGEVVYVNEGSNFVLIKTTKPVDAGEVLQVFNKLEPTGKVKISGERSRGVTAADILEGKVQKGFSTAKRKEAFSERSRQNSL